jgi:molybdopterin synthase catalytic subunit
MFTVSPGVIPAGALNREMDSADAGALVTFEGRVRRVNEGRRVVGLEYEAYETLANSEGRLILDEARKRFPVLGIRCVHRVGRLGIGELAVLVGVLSAHRDEAFEACRFVIDQVKHRVPIWKKEFYADGDSGWVRCEHGPGHTDHGHSPCTKP